MTFANDEGEILEVAGQLVMTKRSVSFFNAAILGDFSVNFDVDNNSVNRKVLNYNGPQDLNQVAFTRQAFTLVRNGNPFMRGFIVIQSDMGDTLSCYFISGNSNWLNLVRGLITELDYSGVTNVIDYSLLWTLSGVGDGQGQTSGITFPMVDWAYDGNKGNNVWFSFGTDGSVDAIIDVGSKNSFGDFYPCFYLHSLITEITKQNGINIAGSILQNKLYQTLVISSATGEMRRPPINATTARGSAQAVTTSLVKYTALTQDSDPEGLFDNAAYTANKTSLLIFTINVTALTGTVAEQTAVSLVADGSLVVDSVNLIESPAQTGSIEFRTIATAGTVYDLRIQKVVGSTAASITMNFKIEISTVITPGDLILPNYFLPELQCIDILLFVINYFGCSVYFDEYSKTLSINIVEGMKKEDADNWSNYFKGATFEYTIDSAANNYLRLETSEDTEVKGYNEQHQKKYGEGNIQTGNSLLTERDLFIIPFAASEYGLNKNGNWMANIPLVSLKDSGNPILYTTVAGAPELFFTNAGYDLIFPGQLVRIVDDINGDIGVYVAKTSTGGQTTFFGLVVPVGTLATGRLYTQSISFNTIAPRLLVVRNETSLSDFSLTASSAPISTTTYGYFAKSKTGLPADNLKANCAFQNPDIEGFSDPDILELYFNKIGSMLGNPRIRATMLLPEAVFQSWKFDKFIYLETEKLTGYFWVESIENYVDASTEVEVILLML